MTDIRKLIATNLSAIMHQEDVTPDMLREWTGLAGRTINDVLWGRRDIRFDNLALIAEVLKRPVKDFFTQTKEKER